MAAMKAEPKPPADGLCGSNRCQPGEAKWGVATGVVATAAVAAPVEPAEARTWGGWRQLQTPACAEMTATTKIRQSQPQQEPQQRWRQQPQGPQQTNLNGLSHTSPSWHNQNRAWPLVPCLHSHNCGASLRSRNRAWWAGSCCPTAGSPCQNAVRLCQPVTPQRSR